MTRHLSMALTSLFILGGCATVDSSWSRIDVSDLRAAADEGDAGSARRLAEVIARGVARDGDLTEAIDRLRSLEPSARPADRALLAVVLTANGQLQGAFDRWIQLVIDESARPWIRRLAALRATPLVDRVSLNGVMEALKTSVGYRGVEAEVSDLYWALGTRLESSALVTLADRMVSSPGVVKRSGRVRAWSALVDEDTTWDEVRTRRGVFLMPDEGPGVYEALFELEASERPRAFEVRTGASISVWWGETPLGRQDRWGDVAAAHSRWEAPPGARGQVRLRFQSVRGGFRPRVILSSGGANAQDLDTKPETQSTLLKRLASLESALHERDVEGAREATARLARDRYGVAVTSLVRRLDWDPTLAEERTHPERLRLLVESIEETAGLGAAQADLIARVLSNGDLAHARALRASAALGEAGEEIDLMLAVETENRQETQRLSARLFSARPRSCRAARDWLETHWEALAASRELERATWPGCASVTALRARLALESSRLDDAVDLATQAARRAEPGEERVETTLLLLEALWRSDKGQEAMSLASRFVATREPGGEQVLDWIVRHGAPESVRVFEQRLRSHRDLSQEVRASTLRAKDVGLPLTNMETRIVEGLDGVASAEAGSRSVEVLFQERFVKALSDGTLIHRHHQLFLVRSKEALEAWGEVPLPEGAEVLIARTWRRASSGRLLAVESEDWSSTGAISLSGLGEGTVAEVAVVWIEEPDEAHAPTWSTARFPLGFEDADVAHARVVLHHGDRQPIQVESGGQVRVTREEGRVEVEAQDVSALPVEPLDPRPELRLPWVRFSGGAPKGLTVQRWHAAEALRAARALRVTPTVAQRAAEITKGLSDERERLEALHGAVLTDIQDEATSLGAYEASVVLGRGAGERSVALVALCRAAGHRCDLVAARPMARGLERPLEKLVDSDDWVYPIVRAKTRSGVVWLDTASAYSPFDFIPPMLAGVEGLVLDNALSRVRLPPAQEGSRGQRVLELTVRVSPDGSYVAQGEETLTGLYAMSWRHVLVEMTAEQRQNALDRLVQASLPGSGLETLRFEGLETRGAPLVVHWRAHGATLSGEKEARLSVALSPENLSRSTVHLAKRSAPLLVSRSTDLEVRLTIELPVSWRLSRPPASIEVDQSLIRYHRSAESKERSVRIFKTCGLSVGLISPSVYPSWVEAARDVDRADRIELVFERPAQ